MTAVSEMLLSLEGSDSLGAVFSWKESDLRLIDGTLGEVLLSLETAGSWNESDLRLIDACICEEGQRLETAGTVSYGCSCREYY